MDSKVSFIPLADAANVDSRYLVIDISVGNMDIVLIEDDGALPDGHTNKNLAVIAACSKKYDTAIICLLQLSEDGTILMKVAIGMVSLGVLLPPPTHLQPIHMLKHKDGLFEKVKYVTLPFQAEYLIPHFKRLLNQ